MEKEGVSIPFFSGAIDLLRKEWGDKSLPHADFERIRSRMGEIEAIYRGEGSRIERDGSHFFPVVKTPEEWIVSEDVGVSSRTIWAVLMGLFHKPLTGPEKQKSGGRWDVPHDPSDFGRCHRMFQHIPAWKGRLNEVAAVFPAWEPMVREWDRMAEIYERDLESGKSPELYELMCSLEVEGREIEAKVFSEKVSED
jgi:hypothetical protein